MSYQNPGNASGHIQHHNFIFQLWVLRHVSSLDTVLAHSLPDSHVQQHVVLCDFLLLLYCTYHIGRAGIGEGEDWGRRGLGSPGDAHLLTIRSGEEFANHFSLSHKLSFYSN